MASSTKNTVSTNKYETYLDQRITQTSQQVKWVELLSYSLGAAIYLLASLFLLCLVDAWIFELQVWMRWTALILLVLGCLAVVIFRALPYFLNKVNPLYAAKMLEDGRPELKNSVINYLTTETHSDRKSAEIIRQKMSQKAASDVANIPIDTTVDRSKMIFAGYTLAAVVAAFALYIVLSPKDPFQTIGRVILPSSDLMAPSRVKITEVNPGSEQKYFGESVLITAKIKGMRDGEYPKILLTSDDGRRREFAVPMTFDENSNTYQSEIGSDGGLKESFAYRIEAGDAKTVTHRIDVRTCPTIFIESVDYAPPAYTEILPHTIENPESISGVEGTIARIYARTNLPAETAYLELLREIKIPAEQPGTADQTQLQAVKSIRLEPATEIAQTDADRSNGIVRNSDQNLLVGELTLELNAKRDGQRFTHYRITFTTAEGDKSQNPNLAPIEITPDLSPEIVIETPREKSVQVPENQVEKIEVSAVDPDYGLTAITLVAEHKGNRLLQKLIFRSETVQGVSGKQVAQFRFRPDEFGLKSGAEVIWYARAEDNRALGSRQMLVPNRKRTQNYKFVIVDPLKSENSDPNSSENPDNNDPDNNDPENNDPPNSSKEKDPQQKKSDQQDPNQNSQPKKSDQQSSKKKESEQPQKGGNSKDQQNKDSSQKQGSSQKQDPSKQQQGSEQKKQSGTQSNQSGKSSDSNQSGGVDKNDPQQSESGTSGSKTRSNKADQNSQPKQSDSHQNGKSDPQKGAEQNQGSKQPSESQPNGESNQEPKKGNSQDSTNSQASDKQSNQNSQPEAGNAGSENSERSTEKPSNSKEAFERLKKYFDEKNKEENKPQSEKNDSSTKSGQSSEDSANRNNESRDDSPNKQDQNSSSDPSNQGDNNSANPEKSKTDNPKKSGSGRDSKDPSRTKKEAGTDQSKSKANSTKSNDSNPKKQESGKKENPKSGSGNQDQKKNEPGKQGSSGDSSNKSQSKQDDSNRSDPTKGNSGQEQGKKDQTGKADGSSGKKKDAAKNDPSSQNKGADQKNPKNNSDRSEDSASKGNSKEDSSEPSKSGDSKSGDSKSGDSKSGDSKQGSDDSASPKQGSQSKAGEKSGKKQGDSRKGNQEDQSQSPSDKSKQQSGGDTGDANQSSKSGQETNDSSQQKQAGQPAGGMTEADKANLDYTRKTTEMVLEKLKDQQNRPDQNLLKDLNWTEEELRDFTKRWDTMRKKAKSGTKKDQKRFKEALRSLGLTDPANKVNPQKLTDDKKTGYKQRGGTRRVPTDFAKQFRAIQKSQRKLESQQ